MWEIVVCWLLNVPATCLCISWIDLLRQCYVLPHWHKSCRSNFLPQPVTVYRHWANQSQHWPHNARRLARKPLERQFSSHWYDLTQKKSRRKRDSKPRSSALAADTLTTRPTRWCKWERIRPALIIPWYQRDEGQWWSLALCPAACPPPPWPPARSGLVPPPDMLPPAEEQCQDWLHHHLYNHFAEEW